MISFNASNKGLDPKKFKNLRAEQWWKLRVKFENGEIDLDPDDEDLSAELMTLKWWINSSGQIQLESKEDMKKRGLPSPDHGDAVMMSTVDDDVLDMEEFVQNFSTVHGVTDDLLERPM